MYMYIYNVSNENDGKVRFSHIEHVENKIKIWQINSYKYTYVSYMYIFKFIYYNLY